MTAWRAMTAAELGRGIGAGTICPVALTEAFLEAIAADPQAPRIYARTMGRQALDTAMGARARAKAGLRRGPLDGVPVAWKDLFDTAGVATEAGSALLAGRVPDRDAVVVARLTAAGLPPLGKTHMTELAFSGLGLNPVTASPPCVNDPGAVPGGSSSGSAAAVAFGLAPLAIGSDTGGSVRLPAAWNDLVGLKTTAGRVPLTGVVPLAARFDTVGPLARSVQDAALAFALLDGSAAPDLKGARLAGARLLVLETVALEDLDAPVAAGFEDALARLAAAGARIARGAVPGVAEAVGLAGILYTAECWGTWGAQIEAAPDLMYPPVRERFRSGAAHLAADYVAAWLRLDALRAAYAAAVAGYDAVVMPTAAGLPPKAAPLLADAAAFAAANLRALRNTRIGNLTGGCALTLPTGHPSVGISLMAGPGEEARLLRLGAAAEAALAR
jgi:aspartyl-tRNA(Asn)/glutamyl-tRNA(Gln) amidotransferase subunit A